MRIVGQEGHWYLIQLDAEFGRILDLRRGRLYAPMTLVSLLAKGGWEPFTGDEAEIHVALSKASDLEQQPTDQPPLAVA